ncbi:MAG: immunoglobulin domain-containing protein [Verrucomicrobia bacterium]|nr:immunoglobulin domain-containing protein [Verrucomicrobiota bacterium]
MASPCSLTGHTGGISGHVNEFGAEGKNFVEFYNAGSRIYQGVPTAPGRVYIVRFAHGQSPDGQAANLRVKWNGEVIGDAGFSSTFYQPWYYTNFLTTPATGNVSTLEFEGQLPASRLDDVSVGWAGELPSIQAQAPSRSVFEGGTVSFPVVATGSPPLTYQWYCKNQPVAEATNRVLVITNATQQTEGEYLVVITNAFGEVRSLSASLVVHPIPNVPQLIFQPKSLQMTVGYLAGFHVFAVGSPALSYQWQFEGTNVAGATSAHFLIPIVDLTNTGTYTVVVSNHFGTTLSTLGRKFGDVFSTFTQPVNLLSAR